MTGIIATWRRIQNKISGVSVPVLDRDKCVTQQEVKSNDKLDLKPLTLISEGKIANLDSIILKSGPLVAEVLSPGIKPNGEGCNATIRVTSKDPEGWVYVPTKPDNYYVYQANPTQGKYGTSMMTYTATKKQTGSGMIKISFPFTLKNKSTLEEITVEISNFNGGGGLSPSL